MSSKPNDITESTKTSKIPEGTQNVTINLAKPLVQILDELAKLDGVSRNSLLTRIIKDAIDEGELQVQILNRISERIANLNKSEELTKKDLTHPDEVTSLKPSPVKHHSRTKKKSNAR